MTGKKRHIGNDFVNIVFNDSGLPFDFDTFPSQFNYVYIVITPASRATFAATREAAEWRREGLSGPQPFYTVQVISKPGFPEISPASEPKMVSLAALPSFVRLLALNASVFSMVWENRAGGEHVSFWRSRLQEIRRLREKHLAIAKAAAEAAASNGNQSQPQQQQQQQQPQNQAQQLQQQQQAEVSRPSSTVRDSLTSLRRTSVATFFTTTTSSEQPSHRSSTISASNATADTETGNSGPEWVMDSVDFSRWA